VECDDDSLWYSDDESSENLSTCEPSTGPSEFNQRELPLSMKTAALDSEFERRCKRICEDFRAQNPTLWESSGQDVLDFETACNFVHAVRKVSSEQMKHAYNCKKEGIVYQAANSKKNACIYARRILLVESDFLLVESDFQKRKEKKVLFRHHNTQNNFDTTLSLNIEKMVGHIFLPFMLKALILLFRNIKYITMPQSNKQTITQVHINFATLKDKNLARHFIEYYTQAALDLRSIEREHVRSAIAKCEELPPKLRDLIGLKDDGKDNMIGFWTRDKFVPKDTFELETDFIVRHVYDEEEYKASGKIVKSRVEVSVAEVERWMVREFESGKSHHIKRRKQNGKKGNKHESEGAKQIGEYCVIEFDHEFNLNYVEKNKDVKIQDDIKIKVVHCNPSSGAVAVELSQDKHIINLGTETKLEISHLGSHSSENAYRTGPASVESESSKSPLSATRKQLFKYPHPMPATREFLPSPFPFHELPHYHPQYPVFVALVPLFGPPAPLYSPVLPIPRTCYPSDSFTASPHNVHPSNMISTDVFPYPISNGLPEPTMNPMVY